MMGMCVVRVIIEKLVSCAAEMADSFKGDIV